ncbi:hypothetical protein HanPSC8_Chr01g0026411 [Helianthus annuus]|nr:hypothetical protein HanPSC8_Chr01g0026411 [Helianthus annuus]
MFKNNGSILFRITLDPSSCSLSCLLVMTESRTGRLAVTRIDDQRYLEILDFISTHVSRYWMSEAICGIEMAKVQVRMNHFSHYYRHLC